jgi:hypothetical protein
MDEISDARRDLGPDPAGSDQCCWWFVAAFAPVAGQHFRNRETRLVASPSFDLEIW